MKRVLRNSLLVASATWLLLVSCGEKVRTDVLPPEKLEAILYDYHLAQVMVSDLPSSERYKKDLYFDYVYDKHGVTEAQIDSSLVYYARYPKDLSLIYTNMSSRLDRELGRIEEGNVEWVKREAVPVSGDTADLWYDAKLIQLTSSPIDNRYVFTVPADTNFKAGDKIVWSGDVLFFDEVIDSIRHYLYMNLMVKFANDSLLQVDTLMYASGSYLLEVPDTSKWVIKSVDGEVYLKNADAISRLLLVSPHLMRYHANMLPDSLQTDTAITADVLEKSELKVAPNKMEVAIR